ncbi:MAG: hydroxyacid dehydrogenase [Bacteroidales bacterium]|jgi:D-3-phosphoglycerate dehydrogenase|nr:hydroxyacid dehydrogenase [Bacteroidales bacterium]
MKIVVVEPVGISAEKEQEIRSRFTAMGHEFVFYPDRNEDKNVLVQRMRDADIVVISNIKTDADILSQCHRLKMLSVAFTGLDHIDLEYCRRRGIAVNNASGYADVAVSELAVGLMIALCRRIPFLDAQTRRQGCRDGFLGRQLCGQTVGIVGTGAIGTYTALTLQKMGCNIIAWSRTENKTITDNNIPYYPLDKLLATADIISLHLPLTSETFRLIDGQKLALCQRHAMLINTARGDIVDNKALADALHNGTLAGAGIDVFEYEPPLSDSHPLISAPNCILVPHIGYATEEAFGYRIDIVFRNIVQWLEKGNR